MARRMDSPSSRQSEPVPARYGLGNAGPSIPGWIAKDSVLDSLLPFIVFSLLVIGGAYVFSTVGVIAGLVLGLASFSWWTRG